jgi:hypothetical protein
VGVEQVEQALDFVLLPVEVLVEFDFLDLGVELHLVVAPEERTQLPLVVEVLHLQQLVFLVELRQALDLGCHLLDGLDQVVPVLL